MNELNKYEISLWEDYLVTVSYKRTEDTTPISGKDYYTKRDDLYLKAILDNEFIEGIVYYEIDYDAPNYFDERKIGVIGSNTMTAQWRAVEPKLVENINGTNTLTFKMYYTYIDIETGEKVKNPFINLMVNERKIKAFWKNKWYDLVIKNIQEDSNGKSITYTCNDLFINELSKTGFELEFDEKLGNNQGTVEELGAKVLEGTDWQLGECDIIEQLTEEAVYEVTGSDMVGSFQVDDTTISTTNGGKLLVFYSTVINKRPFFQFLYSPNGTFTTEENGMLIVDEQVHSIDGAQWSEGDEYVVTINEATITFNLQSGENVSTRYRAKRPVRQQKIVYDSNIKETVYVYTHNGKEIYGIEHAEFSSPTAVVNLLVNYENFSTTQGWSGGGIGAITFGQYPLISESNISNYNPMSYLQLARPGLYLNSGIKVNLTYLPTGFQKGERYIVRIKAKSNLAYGYLTTPNSFIPRIGKYSFNSNETTYAITSDYFTVINSRFNDGWLYYTLKCTKSCSKNSLLDTNDFGFLLQTTNTTYIEQIQLFKETYGGLNGATLIYPGNFDTQGVVKVVYTYYDKDENVNAKSIDDLVALYKGTEPWDEVEVVNNTNNGKEEKIRSITEKNSNRFNLLQTLAETFECWIKFDIEHDETGKIKLVNGIPQKKASFREKIGTEVGAGFIYGIDLKQISRTITSDKITSKVIVTPNFTEVAENGICTIAASRENYSRSAFILNFDYYINKKLLDGAELNKDLYQSVGAIGYYFNLHKLNLESESLGKESLNVKNSLDEQESMLKVYGYEREAALTTKTELESEIIGIAGTKTFAQALQYAKNNPNNTDLQSKIGARTTVVNNYNNYDKLVKNLEKSVEDLTKRKLEIDELIKTNTQNIADLNKQFYIKYSRFIQEGSWTSQDYVDNDEYYFDAQSVAYTSSRPQISYNISVLRLSGLEEFKHKIFKLGDITYIQDTEFFGYQTDGFTPYKEKVLVSEITSNFDSPDKDSFKIQNYKTQFEDLFQRITSTTQALQYAQGEYQRAANIVEPDGTINALTLQNSFAVNQNLVISAQNETFIQDSTGLTLIDSSNPNNKVKITSGGIFLSTDGGATWKNGIRGTGISTQYLTAGAINTNNITIMDGNHSTFRWDSDGINAFYKIKGITEEETEYEYVDQSTFVRFDRFGIYGISGYSVDGSLSSFVPQSEEEIWNTANFGLTWKGFFLRTDDGAVSISSDNDIQIFKNGVERIKIGKTSQKDDIESTYGMRVSNESGVNILNIGALLNDEVMSVQNAVGEKTLSIKNDGSISLEGVITAKEGYIGDFEIVGGTLSSDNVKISPTGIEVYTKSDTDQIFFTIYNHDDEPVFQVNNEGNLEFSGELHGATGSFSGELEAASGSFSGDITAESGSFTGQVQVGQPHHYEEITVGNSFDSNYAYYTKTEDGEYIQVSITETPNSETTYYTRVEDDKIVINGNNGSIQSTNYNINTGEGFLINSDGSIVANNITLGNNATIGKYIKLGNAYIYNPETYDGELEKIPFLIVENPATGESPFLVTNDGELVTRNIDIKNGKISEILMVGSNQEDGIVINGLTGDISSSLYGTTTNNGWIIRQDGSAVFNNVTVRGQIEAAVFKYNEIQTVSGSLLVRPSSLIEEATLIEEIVNEQTIYKLKCVLKSKDKGIFQVNDFCSVITPGKVFNFVVSEIIESSEADNDEVDYIVLTSEKLLTNEDVDSFKEATLISLGQDGSIGISINSTSSEIVSVPEAIAFFEEQIVQDIEKPGYNIDQEYKIDKLIIGRLPHKDIIPESMQGRFGLYAEDVYLKGQMISVNSDKTWSAGINTNGIEFNTDTIVFWAGAHGVDDEAIKNAPFKVTQSGSIIATKGIFSGTIESAEIHTAKIIGTGNGEDGLIIQSQSNDNDNVGIIFNDAKGTAISKLYNNGFKVGSEFELFDNLDSAFPYFYSKKNSRRVSAEGIQFVNNNTTSRSLINNKGILINNDSIAFGIFDASDYLEGNGAEIKPGFSINYNSVSVALELNNAINNTVIKIEQSLVDVLSNLKLEKSLLMADNVELKQTRVNDEIIGYDLYVR